jgi:3-oxoacyl-[acyl-carrier-protein] synthase II
MNRSAPMRVSGMAWTTALGDELAEVWERLLAGQTGLARVPYEGRVRNELAAAVRSVPLDRTPHERLVEMAARTLRKALQAAGRSPEDPELTFVLATSLGAYLEETAGRPLHAWADEAARRAGALQPPVALSTACSSSSDAILVGAEMIRSGAARRCVCGGADVLTTSKRLAHSALGTMSPTALRTCDVRHDGTLLGEGAAFLVLEAADDASARPLTLLRGVGSANDGAGMTSADASGLGARYAMERSLADAGVGADEIGLISAHGSGTIMNDESERVAFREVFSGRARPLVFATKGNFGHTLGATGAVEAIALVLALREGWVPPIVNLEQPDPEFPLPLSYPAATPGVARYGLSLTLGFGGFDTSLIFEAVP